MVVPFKATFPELVLSMYCGNRWGHYKTIGVTALRSERGFYGNMFLGMVLKGGKHWTEKVLFLKDRLSVFEHKDTASICTACSPPNPHPVLKEDIQKQENIVVIIHLWRIDISTFIFYKITLPQRAVASVNIFFLCIWTRPNVGSTQQLSSCRWKMRKMWEGHENIWEREGENEKVCANVCVCVVCGREREWERVCERERDGGGAYNEQSLLWLVVIEQKESL